MKGTAIHEAIEIGLDIQDAPDDQRGYLKAAHAAMEAIGLDYWLQECQLVNLDLGYAGTADGLMILNQLPTGQVTDLAVLDWKSTSSTAGWREHQLQLAAYAMATHVQMDGELVPMEAPITRLIIVGLKEDGTADIRQMWDPETINRLQAIFRGLLQLHHLDQDKPWLHAWDTADEGVTL
jgi:hypothetical protein